MRYEKAIVYGLISALATVVPFFGDFLSIFCLTKFSFLKVSQKENRIGFVIAMFSTVLLSMSRLNFISAVLLFFLQFLCFVFLQKFNQSIKKNNKIWWCSESVCIDEFLKSVFILLVVCLFLISNVDFFNRIYLSAIEQFCVLFDSLFFKTTSTKFYMTLFGESLGRFSFVIVVQVLFSFVILKKQNKNIERDDFNLGLVYANKNYCLFAIVLHLLYLMNFDFFSFFIGNLACFSKTAPFFYGLSIFHFFAEKFNSRFFIFVFYFFALFVPLFFYFVCLVGCFDCFFDLRGLIRKKFMS